MKTAFNDILKMLGHSLWCTSVLLLVSCGGSDNGTSSAPPSDPSALKQEQAPLYFQSPEVAITYGDPAPNNPLLGGSGEGAVIYTSSDNTVAKVNAVTGRLDIIKAGDAMITAEKSADANNFSATASYALRIAKSSQTPLSFAQSQIEQYIDETPTQNPVTGGSGAGITTFSSSNAAIAKVDAATGELTFIDDGTVTISAFRPADEQYASASADYTLTVLKYPQAAFTFSDSLVEAALGFNPDINTPMGGSGTGGIEFISSDSAVASVDAITGQVDLHSAGTAVITAVKAEDSIYLAAQAQYELTAYDIIGGLNIHVGQEDTLVNWSDQWGVIEAIRTSTSLCDLDVFFNCPNYAKFNITSSEQLPIIDYFSQLSTKPFLFFQNSEYRARPIYIDPAMTPFSEKTGATLIGNQDKLLLVGGKAVHQNSTVTWYDDLWTSRYGAHWELADSSLEIGSGSIHSAATFNNALYLTRGQVPTDNGAGSAYDHTVWRTEDTGQWSAVFTPEISPQSSSQLIVFKDRLWIISSEGVWHSGDGSQWSESLGIPTFSYRNDFSAYVFDEQLFISGGFSDPAQPLGDIWHTSDGIEWFMANENTAHGPRINHQVVTLNGVLYLLGGSSENAGVYTSTNGIDWHLAGEPDTVLPENLSATVLDNRLWITGEGLQSLLSSDNGVTWYAPVDSTLEWSERY